jgi:hypothetical protein
MRMCSATLGCFTQARLTAFLFALNLECLLHFACDRLSELVIAPEIVARYFPIALQWVTEMEKVVLDRVSDSRPKLEKTQKRLGFNGSTTFAWSQGTQFRYRVIQG